MEKDPGSEAHSLLLLIGRLANKLQPGLQGFPGNRISIRLFALEEKKRGYSLQQHHAWACLSSPVMM